MGVVKAHEDGPRKTHGIIWGMHRQELTVPSPLVPSFSRPELRWAPDTCPDSKGRNRRGWGLVILKVPPAVGGEGGTSAVGCL